MEEEKKETEVTTEAEQTEEVVEEVQAELTPEEKQEKKIKNLISLVILLAGLFVGSLFVDVAQLFRGGGFSQKVLNNTDVFQTEGKTWVAYSEPMVKVQVVTDDTCEACNPDEALLGLRRVMPTMLTEKIDANSEAGKALLKKFEIKTIPALIFSKELEKTELFGQAQQFFVLKDGAYALKTAEVGLPIGKYVEAPAADENDIRLGSQDAKATVVEFADFASPQGKTLHQQVIDKMLQEYGDKVSYVFKSVPVNPQSSAQGAALAAGCAFDQGKFAVYADKLFDTQNVWVKMKDANGLFKAYALQLGLNAGDFNKCLDAKKYQDQIAKSSQQAQDLSLGAIPSVFVNENLQASGVKYDDLKKALDEQLAK